MTDLAALKARLGDDAVRTDDEALVTYGRDWTRHVEPRPLAVVFPRSTEDVASIVGWARAGMVGLVPSGGRTGLSGGAVAARGELVVSFERMQRILSLDPIDRSMTCEAGVVTEAAQTHAREHGLYYPVDFASRGSSAIGGNVATNAGGIKVLRYGSTREWVSGLRVVTGTGEVLELNRGLVKNATGYDLRHLFIGSEGTLGFITHVTLKLTRPPPELTVMVLGMSELDRVMRTFALFGREVDLYAFEMFSRQAMELVTARGHVGAPFATPAPWYVLLEVEKAAEERALAAFEKALELGIVLDGVLSQSEKQARELWRLREDISESCAPHTPYKNDLAVRIADVPAFLREVDALFSREYPAYRVIWFGHIGDGNLHINILKPPDLDKAAFYAQCQRVDEQLFAAIERFGGSISAEHGVGLVKRPFLSRSRSPAEIALMRGVKAVFDPDGIMNPGKVL